MFCILYPFLYSLERGEHMLVVTSLQGQTEPLPDINGVEVPEQVNGEYSLSFVCFNTKNNEHAYPLVQEEATVELDGHEFRIKQMTEVRDRKEVHAQHIFFDLVDHYQEGTFGGTHTVDEFFSYALNGTGWTFENVDVTGSAFIPNFGEGNVVALIRQICDAFGCEIKIEPNRHIKIYKQIGEDKDEQFRYKHNIKTIKKSVDTTKLATVIKGYGANGLVVEYRSPNEAIYGLRYAEPIKDDRYTIAESLMERLKQELVDVPEVSIELELSQLGFDVELGDRVWMIYEPLGIDFQTRVMEIKRYPFTKRSPVVTLSNKKRVFTDILTETKIDIDETKKETRSRIEQTNERITLEVERIDDSIATLQIEADNIQLSVQSLDSRLGNAEAQLVIQANQIEQKVSYSDYNGNEIVSRINQTATTIDIEASKINLVGAVTVLSDISGNLGTITAGTLNGVVINIDTDATVGNNLYLGNPSSYGVQKSLYFNNMANIVGGFGFAGADMEVNADRLYLDTNVIFGDPDGYHTVTVDFSNATVTGLSVPYASSAGDADTLDGYHASSFAMLYGSPTFYQVYSSTGVAGYFKYDNYNYIKISPSGIEFYVNGSLKHTIR
jgi:phage minor structural protein